jgi:hypothetical protein
VWIGSRNRQVISDQIHRDLKGIGVKRPQSIVKVASWSKKIYLSFWLTLLFITAVCVIFLPKILDTGKEGSIKGLEAAPQLDFSDENLGQVVTRFPTRPFLEGTESATTQPSQAEATPTTGLGPGGLPTRTVAGVHDQSVGDRVTTRAFLRANASVFTEPQTTAKILGRVGTQTKVRWLDKAGEDWEEILLKDGRSAYVQSTDLSFSADSGNSNDQPNFPLQGQSDGPDVSSLPATVETFLSHLSRNDVPRAETYLSPLAPRLGDLGPLAPYVGVPNDGRVNRIEQIGGGREGHRRVRLMYGPEMLHEVNTLWEWDRSQGRWMLVSWDSR